MQLLLSLRLNYLHTSYTNLFGFPVFFISETSRAHQMRNLRFNNNHWVDISPGGLFVPDGIIHPVVSASITGSIPLLLDYLSPRVSSVQ